MWLDNESSLRRTKRSYKDATGFSSSIKLESGKIFCDNENFISKAPRRKGKLSGRTALNYISINDPYNKRYS
jgi:hypothetical protein